MRVWYVHVRLRACVWLYARVQLHAYVRGRLRARVVVRWCVERVLEGVGVGVGHVTYIEFSQQDFHKYGACTQKPIAYPVTSRLFCAGNCSKGYSKRSL